MSSVTLSTLPEDLRRPIRQIRSRIVRLTILRGVFRTVAVLSAVIVAALVTDFMFDWSSGMRTFWQVAAGAATVAGIVGFVVLPLRRSLQPAELASLVDLHYPELRERLTSTIELLDPNVPETQKGSALMRDYLVDETLKALPRVDPAESVPTGRTMKNVYIGLAAIAILLSPFVLSPASYSLLWSRLLHPSGNYAALSNLFFEIENADRVAARGSDVELRASPQWRFSKSDLPESVYLVQRNDDGDDDRRRMEWDAEHEQYAVVVPHVQRNFEYVLSADDVASESHRITVVDSPEIATVGVSYEPPAYTGLPAKTFNTATGRLTVFERSAVRLDLTFNKPVETIDFEWDETARSIDDPPEAAPTPVSQLNLPQVALAEDKTSAVVTLTADVEGPYTIRLTDEYSLHNLQDPPRSISILRDRKPTIEVAGDLQEQIEARPSDKVRIAVTAADDVAVAELELHVKLPSGGERIISAAADQLGRTDVNYEFVLDLAPLGLKEGKLLTWRIRAADERPIPEPNVTWTSPAMITIDNEAAALSENAVLERQQKWKEELDKLRKQLVSNADLVEALKDDAEERQKQNEEFKRDEEITPLANHQRKIAGEMETLSLEFARQPLYREMTDVLQQLARDALAPLSDRLDSARSADLKKKTEDLQSNEQGVREVASRLGDLQEVLEQLAEIEKDLLELDRLSNGADQLAKKAAELEQKQRELDERLAADPSLAQNSEFLEQTDKIEQEFDALAEEQQKLTDSLKDLLQKRPELVDAARQRALDQLKDLGEQIRKLAEPQDALAKDLKDQAEQTGRAQADAREQQKKLLEALQKLLAEADRQANAAAVPPVDAADAKAADESLARGDLDDARRAQARLKEELARLADQLKQQEPLPADPKQALEELAKREDELAKEIEQTAAQMRAGGRSPSEEQAAEAMRPLARRQEALGQSLQQLAVPEGSQAPRKDAAKKAEESAQQLLAGHADEAAQKAAETAEAMRQLAQQLPENAAENAKPGQRPNPNDVARKARDLAEQLGQIEQQTSELADDPARENADRQRNDLKQRQQNVERQVGELPAEIGRFPRQEALRNLDQAEKQLDSQQLDQAAQNQADARQALEEIADRAEQLARSQQQNPAEMSPEQLAEQLGQLAQREERLGEQTEQAARQQSGTPEQNQTAREQFSELQRRQNDLARESASMALQAVREEGADSEAAKQAVESARKADQASDQLEAGLISEAAEAGENAATAAEQASESAESERPDSGLPSQADDYAKRQRELSDELKQFERNPAGRQAGRQQGQQNLGAQTQQLSQQFGQMVQRLMSEPFNLNQEAGQAQQSQSSSRRAAENMRQSSQNQSQAQQASAARAAEAAAELLRKAANAVSPETQIPDSPVPGEVGDQVAQAYQDLQQAQQLLRQAAQKGQQPGQTQNSQGEPSEQQASNDGRQQGESQDGEPQEGQQQNGERNRPGSQQKNPLQQAAENMRRAAESLQKAAQQSQESKNPSSKPGQEGGNNSSQGERRLTGPPPDVDPLAQIDLEMKKMKMRNWGQLPGKLQTEIIQSRKKNPNADYSELIKLYFEEIARQQSTAE